MIAPTGVPKHRSNVWKPWNLCDRWPINTIPLPPDFKEFLQALNHSKVEYLLVGVMPWPTMAIPAPRRLKTQTRRDQAEPFFSFESLIHLTDFQNLATAVTDCFDDFSRGWFIAGPAACGGGDC